MNYLDSGEIQVSEYYFSDYFRVVLLRDGDQFIASVDVYRKGWFFSGHEEKCVSDNRVCVMFKRVDPSILPKDFSLIIDQVIIVGARISGVEETISVKWVLKKEPSYDEISRIYELSWRIIGCKPPLPEPFHIACD